MGNLTEYLNDNGLSDCFCRKLSNTGKDGREFKTSAFMISYEFKCKNLLYDPNTWPEGCVIREWLYSAKAVNSNPSAS